MRGVLGDRAYLQPQAGAAHDLDKDEQEKQRHHEDRDADV